jgi:hypothetical protein
MRPRNHLDVGAQDEWARAAYDDFLAGDRDLDAMAGHLADARRADGGSGFTRAELADVKDHLMRREHPIEDYEGGVELRRFDPDADIAEAWIRLRSGNALPEDHLLLEHELAELKMMRDDPGLSYQQAHRVANERFNWQENMPAVRQDIDGSW